MIDSSSGINTSNEGNTQGESPSFKDAYKYAIKLLTKKDYSQFKLSLKLTQRGFTENHISDAIEQLKEKKLFQEKNYSESRIKGMLERNYSSEYIQKKLELEHINLTMEEIETVFWDQKVTAEIQIKKLINKKLRNLTLLSETDRNRAISHILSKGHSLELANKCIAAYMSESKD